MQGAHLEDPGSENSDDLQGMHAGDPSREYVLRGHSSHESLIMEGMFPAGHFSQLREPGVVANFPTSHLTHFGSGDSSEVIPAGQSLHSVFESCSCPRRPHWGAPMVAYLPFSHGKSCRGLLRRVVLWGTGCTLKLECQYGRRTCPFRNWYTGRARCRRNLCRTCFGALGVHLPLGRGHCVMLASVSVSS